MSAKHVLRNRSFDYSVRIVKLSRFLRQEHKEYDLSQQILRSGTAIGSLIREAQNAESTKDFIHKLSIAQKECDETAYWLELLYATEYLKKQEFESMHDEAVQLLKMLRSAIITSKKKLTNS